jgi:hypothetical protein
LILDGLEKRDQPDPAKKWHEFEDDFLDNAFPIVKSGIAKYHASDNEVLRIIRERHRHQHELYLEKQDPERYDRSKKRKRHNTRATQVYYSFNIYFFLI